MNNANLRLKGKFFNITVTCVQAPTEVNDDIVKSSFYDRLERVYQTIPKPNAGIVTEDMDAKDGNDPLTSCSGKYSLHEISNDNQERLYDFATSRDLVISSTMFPHKNIHFQTWISPDGLAATQIDHVMNSRRYTSQVTDIRSQRGADSDSDHFMIRIKYRPKISILLKHRCTRCLRCDISKLQDGTHVNRYHNSITEYVNNQLYNNSNVQQQWSTIKQCIYRAAKEITGTIQPNDRNQWFDQLNTIDTIEMSNTL
jgi:hypothetical protein